MLQAAGSGLAGEGVRNEMCVSKHGKRRQWSAC